MRALLEIAACALGVGTAGGLPIVFQSGPKAIHRLMCFACNLRLDPMRPWRGVPGSGLGIGIPFGGGGTTFQDDGSRTDYHDDGRSVTTLPPSPPTVLDRLNDLFASPADPAQVSSGVHGDNEAGHEASSVTRTGGQP